MFPAGYMGAAYCFPFQKPALFFLSFYFVFRAPANGSNNMSCQSASHQQVFVQQQQRKKKKELYVCRQDAALESLPGHAINIVLIPTRISLSVCLSVYRSNLSSNNVFSNVLSRGRALCCGELQRNDQKRQNSIAVLELNIFADRVKKKKKEISFVCDGGVG